MFSEVMIAPFMLSPLALSFTYPLRVYFCPKANEKRHETSAKTMAFLNIATKVGQSNKILKSIGKRYEKSVDIDCAYRFSIGTNSRGG